MAAHFVARSWVEPTDMINNSQPILYRRPLLVEHKASQHRSAGILVQAFVVFQIACQLALLFSAIGPLRVVVRMAVFGSSLLLLIFLPGRGRQHPATKVAIWVLIIVSLSVVHPTTNTLLSGAAQIAMYFAVLAPLFWVSRLRIDLATLRRVILILWLFHTLSAGIGVLQVRFPGSLQPNLSTVVAAQDEGIIDSLNITTASGERVFRPMGLTDSPGGAAVAGFYALLFGVCFFLTERRFGFKVLCMGSMVLALTCLYMSQVRSVLVMAAICLLVFCGVLFRRVPLMNLVTLGGVLAAVILGSFVWAVSIAGESVTDRLATLIEEHPGEVYYTNRGHFLEETVYELLPSYPLGAGLGRWGMMNAYFGDNSDPERTSIWVEIQWTGWLLDGGVPLIIAYVAALFLTCRIAWRCALGRRATTGNNDLKIWGALILAYNVGAIAVTFNYPLFTGQGGLEFWLLNASLFAATETARSTPNALESSRRWKPVY